MALDAFLTLTSSGQPTETLKVLECDYEFSQEIDETGKPSAKPRGGLIHVTVESSEKATIAEWMFAKLDMKDGRLEFSLRNNKKKTLSFEDGTCIEYHESFNSVNNMPMVLRFTISANTIKLGNVTFKNDWKKLK